MARVGEVARLASLGWADAPLAGDVDAWRVPGGTWQLREHQASALAEVARCGGGVLGYGVGAGKTLLALLLPRELGLADAACVVLVPGALRAEYRRQRAILAEHFDVADPHVISYEQLSRPSGAALLEQLAPRLIVADEAHCLGNKDSARTARFLRYCREQQPVFVAMSASLIRNSLHNAAHLAALALGDASPLPIDWNLRNIWSEALFNEDAYPEQRGTTRKHLSAILGRPVTGDLREAFFDHLRHRRGVLFTEEPSCDVPLRGGTFKGWVKTPAAWNAHKRHLAATLELPCGQGVEDELRLHAAQQQLSLGFYARWADVEGPLVNREWYYARKAWSQALAALVALRRPGIDSPALALAAVEAEAPPRKLTPAEAAALAAAKEAWAVWVATRHLYAGEREVVYLDGARQWARSLAEGFDALPAGSLVWSAYQGFTALLEAARPGCVVPPGKHPDTAGERVWRVVSVASHGTGLNLQGYATNLLVTPPREAANLEQLIGRTHRPGQQAEAVTLLLPPNVSLDQQVAAAETLQLITGTKQRLCLLTPC